VVQGVRLVKNNKFEGYDTALSPWHPSMSPFAFSRFVKKYYINREVTNVTLVTPRWAGVTSLRVFIASPRYLYPLPFYTILPLLLSWLPLYKVTGVTWVTNRSGTVDFLSPLHSYYKGSVGATDPPAYFLAKKCKFRRFRYFHAR